MGYPRYNEIRKKVENMREFSPEQWIERSLMKTYKGRIYSKYIEAVDTYRLIENGDKIAIAVSGGKDSLLLAKLMQLGKKYGSIHYDYEWIMMDPGYPESFLKQHEHNCMMMGIQPKIYPSKVFEVAESMNPESPCFLCARMRRGFLYAKAKELGCNKLALGHHFDDVIETTLINVFYTGTFKTMLPRAKAENYAGMELIRPMYLIKEADTIRFAKYHHLGMLDCGCAVANNHTDSKRKEMKALIKDMRQRYVNTDINIFRAAENVNLHQILGYYDENQRHTFMERFETDENNE
jgi:tRNA(Ile)-lysidine synthase TilS/MesJ